MSRRPRNKKPTTLVDVIIPVMNRFDILKDCLDALPEAMGDITYQVYIFDNGSEKLDADLFYRSVGSGVQVHRCQMNIGFPRACNQTFRRGKSPLVFFLNSDVILEKGSVDKLVKKLDDPKVGVVGMKLVFPAFIDQQKAEIRMDIRPEHKLQHIGIVTGIRGDLKHTHVGWDADHPRVNAQDETMAVTGAALMTRRFLFRDAGMFWEGYEMGTHEDVDLCLQIREMGYTVNVVPEAKDVHYTGATAEQYKVGFPLHRNYQLFMQRWEGKLKQWDWRVL